MNKPLDTMPIWIYILCVLVFYLKVAQPLLNGNTLVKEFIKERAESSKLLMQNCSIVITKDKSLWRTSYAPYKIRCPSTPIVRRADNVCTWGNLICNRNTNDSIQASK